MSSTGRFKEFRNPAKTFLTDTAGAGVTGGSSANGLLFFFFLAQRRKWKSEHEVSTPFSLPLPFPLFFLHPCFSPLPLFFLLLSASSRHPDSTPLALGCPGNGSAHS